MVNTGKISISALLTDYLLLTYCAISIGTPTNCSSSLDQQLFKNSTDSNDSSNRSIENESFNGEPISSNSRFGSTLTIGRYVTGEFPFFLRVAFLYTKQNKAGILVLFI